MERSTEVEKVKNVMGHMLGKISLIIAMSSVFILPWGPGCSLGIGEPKIPDSLLKMKEEKYGNLNEGNNM